MHSEETKGVSPATEAMHSVAASAGVPLSLAKPDSPSVDGAEPDPSARSAAERFEANRRYDHRPAIENIDRPTLVFTSRNQPQRVKRQVNVFALLAGLVLLAFAAGTFVGFRVLPTNNSANSSPTAPAAGMSDTVLGDSVLGSAVLTDEVAGQGDAPQADPPTDASATQDVPDTAGTTGTTPVSADTQVTTSTGSEAAGTASVDSERGERSAALKGSEQAAFLSQLRSLNLERLTFAPGEINLTAGGIDAAESVAEVLLAYPDQPVEFQVRTYSESTPGRNHGLSVHQANVLQGMLTDAGVDGDRLAVVGIGSPPGDRPQAAAALFFDSPNGSGLTGPFEPGNPLLFDQPFAGEFDEQELAAITAAATGESPLLLVGYSWSGATDVINHDLSHDLLDAATAVLIAAGVQAERVSTVGMGAQELSLAEASTVITAHGGPIADLAVALSAVPLDAVSFEPSTVRLTESGMNTLDNVAQLMTAMPTVQLDVAVHFYGRATSQGNQDTSQLHADVIGDYLRASGISPAQLRLVAHGDPPHFAVPGRMSVVTFGVSQP